MQLQILYFAGLRAALGVSVEALNVPATVTNPGQLRDWLIAQHGRAALADMPQLKVAINQEMAAWQASLAEGDEVAFFPPVTGG